MCYSSLGPWIMDLGATDHMYGNKDLLYSLTYSNSLPHITVAGGNKTTLNGIVETQHIPSLLLDSVLYVPKSPFNLLSISRITKPHSCLVTSTPDLVFPQDLSMGRMIGEGH